MSNLFDMAREHIPPADKTEAVYQCVVCGFRKGYTQFSVRVDGTRDEWCRECIQREQDEHEEVTCEGYGPTHEEADSVEATIAEGIADSDGGAQTS